MVDINNFFSNPFVDYTNGNPIMDYRDMMEYKPQLAYYSSPTAQSFARSPARRQFFQRSFGDVYNEYLGKLGSQIRSDPSGQTPPTQRFQDFLKTDPFTRRYTRMSPEMRGQFGSERQRTSSPTTRFLYY